MNVKISLTDSYDLKGFALILLLCHHLFYIQNGQYDDFNILGIHVVQCFGNACKLCVAIFVFLSGYGLTVKYKDECKIQIKKYFILRFSKLMINYWFIGVLFIAIGILFFNRTPVNVYHDHLFIKGILDFLGLASCFGFYGYNPTWWFMSCIILLYSLFPFFMRVPQKLLIVLTVLSIFLIDLPWYIFDPIKYYLTTFLIGMLYARGEEYIGTFSFSGIPKIYFLFSFMVLFSVRSIVSYPLFFDNILTLNLVFLFLGKPRKRPILNLLGKHSMNIFLFHTFIYYYYLVDLIHWSRNPFVIFLTLMFVCLFVSMLLEKLKRIVGIDCLIRKIRNVR